MPPVDAALYERFLCTLQQAEAPAAGECMIIHTASDGVAAAAIRACIAKAAIPCVLDRRVPPRAVVDLAEKLAPTAFLTDAAVASAFQPPFASACYLVDPDGAVQRSGYQVNRPLTRELGSDIACVFCTSGSTGERRAVLVTRDNLRFSLTGIQSRLQYRRDDVVGLFVPLSFDYGFYQVLLADQAGARLHLGGSTFAGPDLIEKLRTARVSVLPAVPSLILALLKLLRRRLDQLPDLRMITSTGEHLPRPWIDELRSYWPQVAIYPMYGLTECKRVSILLPEEIDARPDSVGRALDGTRVHVIDEEGRTLPAGSLGQLVITGPHVTRGYLDAPEATARSFRQWGGAGERALFSGDFGYLDGDGYIYVKGRRDGLLKRHGLRMSSAEVEQAAMTVAGVDTAILFHQEATDRLALAVCASRDISPADLLRELGNLLEPYKLPNQIRVYRDFPRNANGKVDRGALKRELGAS